MSEKDTYNGWENYETWLCGLWHNDDIQEYIHDSVDEDYTILSPYEMADVYRDMVEEFKGLEGLEDKFAGFAADMINAAMSKVNWQELADHAMEAQLEAVIEVVESLISFDDVANYVNENDFTGMTPQDIANEWNELFEESI